MNDFDILSGAPGNLLNISDNVNQQEMETTHNEIRVGDPEFYLPGQVIALTETPTSELWCMEPLYKDQMIWQIGYNPSAQCMAIIWGKVGGKSQYKNPPITAVGGKSVMEQALQDIKQRFKIKWRKGGYRFKGWTGETETGVQLAKKYEAPRDGKKGTDLVFPVSVQPKLDGIRSKAYLGENGNTINFSSRSNREQTKFSHIQEELVRFFQYLPAGAGLDGEMFAPVKYFQDLVSIIRRESSVHPDMKIIGYHIFDLIIENVEYYQRYSILVKAYREYIKDIKQEAAENGVEPVYNKTFHILSSSIANSHDEIQQYHVYYTGQGHEGTIIRKLFARCNHKRCTNNPEKRYDRCTSFYQGRNKRNDNLLKLKDMEDTEGTIIGIEEEVYGRDGVSVSLAIFRIRADNGTEFNCRHKATVEQRAYWFNHPEECIGKRYTYQFFGVSKDGVPRHPVGIAIRDYE